MRFGPRLFLFFAVTLLAIQGVTIAAIQLLLRDTLMDDGKAQVTAAEGRFVRQMLDLQEHLAEGVRLLTLDFALRQAIADRDAATVVSALRNHGHRVGASRMLLVAPNGNIDGDTARGPASEMTTFPYPALLALAAEEERAGSVALIGGQPVWLVAVPVMAPDLIAYVAAVLPLDDAALMRLRSLAGVPGRIGIAALTPEGWRGVAGGIEAGVMRRIPEDGTPRAITSPGGEETIATSRLLPTPQDGEVFRVVLDYPLSEVLRHYERMFLVLVPTLGVGLLATLAGAMVISRGVSRPIEILARWTRHIAEGDYTLASPLRRTDELGQLSGALSFMASAIAEREEQIRHQATHDPVTGLGNRLAIITVIDAHSANAPGAVLMIGLSRWRDIISAVGRTVGDRVLCDAARRIIASLEAAPADPTIAAIGESTFAVLLRGQGRATAISTAARLITVFDTPYQEGELTIDTPLAAGIAMLPDHGTDSVQLLRRAEIALLAAIGTETRLAVYRPDADPHRAEQLSLMSDLRVGLTRGEFRLLYQPKLDLKEGRITGAEALVRWHHPVRGLVMPDDFIPLAEGTGNIQHLTRWALRQGLTQVRDWLDQGVTARVSINLSVRDLAIGGLAAGIARLLTEFGLTARSLVLEITESAIMGEPDAAIAVMRQLDQLGIDLAIDDFGVGQSSLAYLRRLPVKEIKLDKAFVRKLADSPDDRAIVQSVIELGHNLGYHVTAEGVEDAASLNLLRVYGCDHAQGYFVGIPEPAGSFPDVIAFWNGVRTANMTKAVP